MWEIKFGEDIMYRIVGLDDLNVSVELWESGGEVIEKGRYQGQLSQAKWKTLGYFGNFEHACKYIVNSLHMVLPNHILDTLYMVKKAQVTLIEKVKNG